MSKDAALLATLYIINGILKSHYFILAMVHSCDLLAKMLDSSFSKKRERRHNDAALRLF